MTSTWDIAFVLEQGIRFAVVSLRDSVIGTSEADRLIQWWSLRERQPVVLIGAQRHRLYGRSDIVRFLERVDPSRLPWRRVTIAA